MTKSHYVNKSLLLKCGLLSSALISLSISSAFGHLTLIAEAGSRSYGDADYSWSVDAKDALAVLKHAANIEVLGYEAEIYSDVNMDNNIDSEDALLILKHCAVIVPSFPIDFNKEAEKINSYNEFEAGVVLVNLHKAHPELNSDMLFPELDVESIKLVDNSGIYLSVKLKEKTKEAVISAVEQLKANPYVDTSDPSFILYPNN